MSGAYSKDNAFAVIDEKVDNDGSSSARLSNPKYLATVERRESGSWRLSWIGSESAVLKESDVHADMFFMHICNPCGVATVMREGSALADNFKLFEQGEGYSFTITKNIPQGCDIHKLYAGAKVRVHGPIDQFPQKCELVYADKAIGSRIEYQSFVDVNGVKVPKTVVVSRIESFDQGGVNPNIYQYDYTRIDEPLDTKRCYLPYYDMSELGNTAAPWRPFFRVLGVAVTILVIIGLIRERKRRQSEGRAEP